MEARRHYQISVGVEDLGRMLKGRIPVGSKLVAIDRMVFDSGIRLLFTHPDYPVTPEAEEPQYGYAMLRNGEDGVLYIDSIEGLAK